MLPYLWIWKWIYMSKFHHQHGRVLFLEDVKKKIGEFSCHLAQQVSRITQQEVIHIIYVDPDTNLPVMKFFEIASPENSQDKMHLIYKKPLFLHFQGMVWGNGGNGASVNSRLIFGLIRLFQEDCAWLAFVWCFSHTLELSLKDALLEFLKHWDTLLTQLFYIFSNSSKSWKQGVEESLPRT